jgi:hypothetical protein
VKLYKEKYIQEGTKGECTRGLSPRRSPDYKASSQDKGKDFRSSFVLLKEGKCIC